MGTVHSILICSHAKNTGKDRVNVDVKCTDNCHLSVSPTGETIDNAIDAVTPICNANKGPITNLFRSSVNLFIVTNVRDQPTWTIANLPPYSTINDLHLQIANKLDVELHRITLNLNNRKPLQQSGRTLSDYDIRSNATIYVNQQIQYDLKDSLQIQTGSRNFRLFDIDKEVTTLQELKKRIETWRDTPIEKQLLFRTDGHLFTENEMECTLTALHIEKSVRLEVAAKFAGFGRMLHDNDIALCEKRKLKITGNSGFGDKFDVIHWYKINNNVHQLTVFQSILSMHNGYQTKTLFHGTSFECIDKILENGFNRDYNVRGLYGKGTYFSNNSKLAASYSKPDGDGYLAMLVCDVIVGEYKVGARNMSTSALCKAGTITEYTTLVDNVKKPSIYVIRRDYHALPKYVIVFRRNSVVASK